MKPTAIIVNIGRSSTSQEDELVRALREGRIHFGRQTPGE